MDASTIGMIAFAAVLILLGVIINMGGGGTNPLGELAAGAAPSALLAAEGDRPGQHVHPQVDVRAAGDLLSRAGFAMPVADGDMLTIRYGDIVRLMHDLRGMGAGNMLAHRPPPLTREVLMRAAAHFADSADSEGRIAEQMAIIYLSGWKPDPSQAQPARRGSATISLAEALKGKAQ